MSKDLRHIGFILDGNRRWAKENGRISLEGHKKGYDNLKDICEHAILDLKIPFVSAYIFSTENWNRSKDEVSYLMSLAKKMADKDVDELHKKNIRVCWLGSKEKLSDDIRQSIERATEKTKDNTAGTVGLCFNYGGRTEIVEAARQIEGEVTEESLAQNLYCPDVPDVDLMIRTSGEQRLSNFMLWRMAYSEMYFTDKYWPDFNNDDLDDAVEDYNKRQRRFGE